MPFIIWGSRGLTSEYESGEFYCPQCDEDRVGYTLKGVRTWFTLYFIPLFPIGGAEKYVECRGCRGTFKEAVLDLKPPTPAERLAAGVGHALKDGMSMREAEAEVAKAGVPADQAGEFVRAIAGEDLWNCPECGEVYTQARKRRCRACAPSRS